eukprot:364617-Chlamydomonas_euryale.AAC.7
MHGRMVARERHLPYRALHAYLGAGADGELVVLDIEAHAIVRRALDDAALRKDGLGLRNEELVLWLVECRLDVLDVHRDRTDVERAHCRRRKQRRKHHVVAQADDLAAGARRVRGTTHQGEGLVDTCACVETQSGGGGALAMAQPALWLPASIAFAPRVPDRTCTPRPPRLPESESDADLDSDSELQGPQSGRRTRNGFACVTRVVSASGRTLRRHSNDHHKTSVGGGQQPHAGHTRRGLQQSPRSLLFTLAFPDAMNSTSCAAESQSLQSAPLTRLPAHTHSQPALHIPCAAEVDPRDPMHVPCVAGHNHCLHVPHIPAWQNPLPPTPSPFRASH